MSQSTEVLDAMKALYDAAFPDKHVWVRGDDTLTMMNTTVAVKVGGETVGVRFRNLALTRAGSPLPIEKNLNFINPGTYVIDVPGTYDGEGNELTPPVLRWAPAEAIEQALWQFVDQTHPPE